jgi:hypothetical protein
MAKKPKTDTIDLYNELKKTDYASPKKPVLLTIKPAQYLTVTGQGEPGGEHFQACMGALFGAAYTMKFTSKFAGRDYKVCVPEGQWWGPEGCTDLCKVPRDQWNWKLMIRTPGFIKQKDLDKAVAAMKEKGKAPAVEPKLETIKEGRCVQMLHVGPYAEEPRTINEMMEFAKANGLSMKGPHHEIYLSDPRRAKPEKLKTILRHPVA